MVSFWLICLYTNIKRFYLFLKFFLDVGHNQRGVFLRITEQTRSYRNAITSKLREASIQLSSAL